MNTIDALSMVNEMAQELLQSLDVCDSRYEDPEMQEAIDTVDSLIRLLRET